MKNRAEELIRLYGMTMLPGEGTFVRELYRSAQTDGAGRAALSTIYGLYSADPPSRSNFHRLTRDEVWSFYEGDPIELFLLYPDGRSARAALGPDPAAGQVYQLTIPAGVWQGGRLAEGGRCALYGCTVAPAFTPDCFRLGNRAELTRGYPSMREIIAALTPDPPSGSKENP